MTKKNLLVTIPDEVVMEKIYVIRSKKVMLDRDLAELYEVVTRRLKEQVRRNMDRFPEDFMFELTEKEHQQLKEQFGKRNRGVFLKIFQSSYGFWYRLYFIENYKRVFRVYS